MARGRWVSPTLRVGPSRRPNVRPDPTTCETPNTEESRTDDPATDRCRGGPRRPAATPAAAGRRPGHLAGRMERRPRGARLRAFARAGPRRARGPRGRVLRRPDPG